MNNVNGSTYNSGSSYYYYYWTITTQSTSYTWTITGIYNNKKNNGTLRNASSRSGSDTALCTISSNTTYTYSGTLPYSYINIIRRYEYYETSTGTSSGGNSSTLITKYYNHFNPLTIYRVNNTYGWG